MCLIVTKPKKNFIEKYLNVEFNKPLYKIAHKDLTFYKVVKKIGKEYFSPFRMFNIQVNVPYKDDLSLRTDELSSIFYEINEGVFHLCKTYESAKELVNKENSLLHDGYFFEILKAIVPKNTKYYEGDFFYFGKHYPSIGTPFVIYKEINEE